MRPFNRKIDFIPNTLFQRRLGAPAPDAAKVDTLARQLDWRGWPSPVILDDIGNVSAGADFVEAARMFGDFHAVPTVLARDLTAEDRAMFVDAAERFAANVRGGAPTQSSNLEKASVTRAGDVWLVGRHRLACGDARQSNVVKSSLEDCADVVFLDPPQNLFGQIKREPYVRGIVRLLVAAMIALRDGGLMFVSVDFRNLHLWLESQRT